MRGLCDPETKQKTKNNFLPCFLLLRAWTFHNLSFGAPSTLQHTYHQDQTTTFTMDELINQVSNKIGVPPEQVQKALGAVLVFLKEQVARKDFDFNQILSHLQGAEQLLQDAQAQEAVRETTASSTGGYTGLTGLIVYLFKTFNVFAILKKILSTFFGENATQLIDTIQDGAELSAVLNKLGIDNEKGVKLVKMLVDFMKDKVSPETVEQLSEKVPALKAFLGDTKKEE